MSINLSLGSRTDAYKDVRDGYTHKITFQGNYLNVRVIDPPSSPPPLGMRAPCRGFSRASRLAVIKTLCKIDFSRCMPGLFITLTFPDGIRPHSPAELSKYRSVFWRAFENHRQKHTACFWRVEWKTRQTGSAVGMIYPHFHLIVSKADYVYHRTVNRMWKEAIGHVGYIRSDTRGLRSADMAAAYVCKYCAKEEEYSLVNAANLNNIPFGRSWGILRRELLPWFPSKTYKLRADQALLDWRRRAGYRLPAELAMGLGSCTLLGPAARAAAIDFAKNYLTKHG